MILCAEAMILCGAKEKTKYSEAASIQCLLLVLVLGLAHTVYDIDNQFRPTAS